MIWLCHQLASPISVVDQYKPAKTYETLHNRDSVHDIKWCGVKLVKA